MLLELIFDKKVSWSCNMLIDT